MSTDETMATVTATLTITLTHDVTGRPHRNHDLRDIIKEPRSERP
jgi:hypothetical protein